jgi:hypothetical protein
MPAKKATLHITQAELDRATAQYLRNGGRIVKLPEQKPYLRSRVGGRWDTSAIDLQLSG